VTRRARATAAVLAAVASASARAELPDGGCGTYGETVVQTGRTPRVLPELSGFAASRRHHGIFWAHNDSGNAFTVHAMREDGTVVASFPILDADAVDPEDIALGPCAPRDTRSCLYVADIGDNLRTRARVQIIRVVEPLTLRSSPLIGESFAFTYPDGKHDAEAILVDPRTADVIVVTKSLLSLGDAYRVDLHGKPRRQAAEHVAALSVPSGFDSLVTAASVHPSGTRLLLRTYRNLWEYRRDGARDLVDVLRATPRDVPGGRQLQGEAVSYTADGTSYLLGGEGDSTPIFRIDCRAEPKPVAGR
jgi:hypothetical protein